MTDATFREVLREANRNAKEAYDVMGREFTSRELARAPAFLEPHMQAYHDYFSHARMTQDGRPGGAETILQARARLYADALRDLDSTRELQDFERAMMEDTGMRFATTSGMLLANLSAPLWYPVWKAVEVLFSKKYSGHPLDNVMEIQSKGYRMMGFVEHEGRHILVVHATTHKEGEHPQNWCYALGNNRAVVHPKNFDCSQARAISEKSRIRETTAAHGRA